jgi:hypothetical protein
MSTQLASPAPLPNLANLTLTPRQLRIAQLLANPDLTQTQVAIITNTSRTTVKAVARKLKDYDPKVNYDVEHYKTLVRKTAPDAVAVKVISEVMGARNNPFARLRAVEYRDTILGLHPSARADSRPATEPQPMFVLPSTTSVTINVTKQGD